MAFISLKPTAFLDSSLPTLRLIEEELVNAGFIFSIYLHFTGRERFSSKQRDDLILVGRRVAMNDLNGLFASTAEVTHSVICCNFFLLIGFCL